MNIQIYVAIGVLVIIAVLFFLVGRNRSENRLTSLAGLAFGFILAGIVFGSNQFLGYGLLAIGVILAVVDIINKAKSK
jgi:hypothetical protein